MKKIFIKLLLFWRILGDTVIKGIEKITEFKQGRKIDIIPRSGHMKFVVDGEITETDELAIEVKDRAMRVLVPYLQV